jgi:hypothetical protein
MTKPAASDHRSRTSSPENSTTDASRRLGEHREAGCGLTFVRLSPELDDGGSSQQTEDSAPVYDEKFHWD